MNNKKNNIKLSAISNIDDDIITESTKKRVELSLNPKKRPKRFAAIIPIAAVLALLMVVVAVLPLFSEKQIPIYTGMTLSNTAPITEVEADPESYVMIRKSGGKLNITPMTKELWGIYRDTEAATDGTTEPTDLTTDTAMDTDGLTVEGTAETIYFAKANEDIYVTVHIDNPKNFAILQFTFNDKVYNSYIFEEGSDMENLVLKYNVGDIIGVTEYTIDAIKYVDGTEIKDVRIDGDRTVFVSIGTDTVPTVNETKKNVGYFDMAFTPVITDEKGLSTKSEGTICAVICPDGGMISEENALSKQSLTVGEENAVKFSGLKHGTAYQYAILATYDSYDGKGKQTHVLMQDSIVTKELVNIKNVGVNDNSSISFALDVNEPSVATVIKLELINEMGETVAEIGADARVFNGVKGGAYKVRATYTYDVNDGKGAQTDSRVSQNAVLVYPEGIMPVNGTVIKEYSDKFQIYNQTTQGYGFHYGVDIASDTDSNVYASFSGVVTEIYEDKSLGTTVVIGLGESFSAKYSNLGSVKEGLKVGDSVSAGDVIGTVGTSAKDERLDTPHLHFEFYVLGKLTDPQRVLKDI